MLFAKHSRGKITVDGLKPLQHSMEVEFHLLSNGEQIAKLSLIQLNC